MSMQPQDRPIVAVTLGDVAGIGPEVALKALARAQVQARCRPYLIGDARIAAALARDLGLALDLHAVADPREARYEPGTIDVVDRANLAPGVVAHGEVSAQSGHAFVDWIRVSGAHAMSGLADAVASAPINKESMHAAGYPYSGQTDIYAEIAGTRDYFTVLVGGPMRVFLVSAHVALRDAIALVRPARVESVLRIAHRTLRELWRIERPLIAVAGLNPHAGDGGLFGREEIDVLQPVMRKLADEGLRLKGPDPCDSLFLAAERGAYDGIVAMYHDQGVTPLKRHGYVTVIAGTPIIRTTAGHGTAYDIAGRGIADDTVMARAITTAAELAALRAAARAPRVTPAAAPASG